MVIRAPTGSDIAMFSYERKSIPNGIDDIAELIGLDPSKTVFDYNVSVTDDVDNSHRSSIQQGIACMSRGEAIALTLGLPIALKRYWQKYLKINNVIEITDYLENNSSYDLYKNIDEKNFQLREKLKHKTFVTLRTTDTAIKAINKFDSTTLLSNTDWKFFNSKARTTSQSTLYDYLVSPYIIISDEEDLYKGFNEIKAKALGLGLDPEATTYWFRFDNLSGGVGVRPFNPSKEDFHIISEWISATIQRTDNKKCPPIVLDIDIGSLPGVKRIIDNLNVQGVCSKTGSTLVGVTQQETDAYGKYQRGKLPYDEKSRLNASSAVIFGMPVICAAQAQGFRGYAGVDVLLAEMMDGTYRGYVLEMNARLNSSTSLLSLAQFVAEEKKTSEICAENININININVNSSICMEQLIVHLDNKLYKGEESGFSGLIPIIAHTNSNGYSQIKTVAVASNAHELARLKSKIVIF